jgi:hypothetical protein
MISIHSLRFQGRDFREEHNGLSLARQVARRVPGGGRRGSDPRQGVTLSVIP